MEGLEPRSDESIPKVEAVHEALVVVADFLERHGLWYAVGFGTLLGAVRDADLIPWDEDFDLYVRPADRARIVDLSEELAPLGYAIKYAVLPAAENLGLVPPDLLSFNAAALVLLKGEEPLGDLYSPLAFSDGVLRHFDLQHGVYWCARNSFPAWFVEERSEVSIRGRRYPALRDPERWLSHVYGPDFRTPWRCPQKGGAPREGFTHVGDRARPSLADLIAGCVAAGWDPSEYEGLPVWPREVHGAGPPADLEDTTLQELVARY